MDSDYPTQFRSLQKLTGRLGGALPEVMQGFASMHRASVADGALSGRTKELIALAIGIAVHCDDCITYHVHDALKAGASHDEIVETIGVAVMMGGGPSVVYGCDALEALAQWSDDREFAGALS